MTKTFIRPSTQIKNSDVYDDTLAAGASMESGPTEIETDLNNLRSQMKRVFHADAAGDWFSDVLTINSKKRGLDQLGADLDDLEEKRILCGVQVLANIAVPAAAAASGSIVAVPKANLIDGETFTLDDGVNPPTVFELDVDGLGVGGGNVAVDVSPDTTDVEVATRMVSAINGVGAGLALTASNAGGTSATVTITNDQSGTVGNVTTWSDTVADAGFIITQPTGGDGDRVVLSQAGGETPTDTAAIGTGLGAVVAVLSGDVGQAELVEIGGQNDLSPKNLVRVRDATTKDAITSGTQQVYGLLQAETGVVQGDAFDDTTKQVQITFVRNNGADDLEVVPGSDIGGRTIEYLYMKRVTIDSIPEDCNFPNAGFIDQAALVDVTLDRAIDNQAGPATQTNNIEVRVDDARSWKYQTADGLRDLLAILPNVAGDEIELNLDTLDVNTVNPPDFDRGAKIATAATEIDVGVNAGVIETLGANDLTLLGAGELLLDDGNQSGSTWVQTAGIKLSETTAEWDAFKTTFGEVSLLAAIDQAANTALRVRKDAAVTTNIPADTLVDGGGGTPNIDAQLADYSSVNFVTDVEIFINGELMRPGADATANHDVYPSAVLAEQQRGAFFAEFQLKASPGNPDQISMFVNGT